MIRATADSPITVTPQLDPATLIPFARLVSHGVLIPASRPSTQVLNRSSSRSDGAYCVLRTAPASAKHARNSHAAALMASVSGGGGGAPEGRRWRRVG